MGFNAKWKLAWKSPEYRKKTIIGWTMLLSILVSLPSFFQYIENRNGILLNDWLLNYLPIVDLSIPIFVLLWLSMLILFVQLFLDPRFALLCLWAYNFICISRAITIFLMPLEPPSGWIELKDILLNQFYGGRFITKDLFYSGHTATVFLIGYCVQNKTLKFILFSFGCLVGVLLLFQHIHYTIDVLTAPLFSFGTFYLSKKAVYPSIQKNK